MGIPEQQNRQQNMSLSNLARPPCLLRHAPVYALHQHSQLRAAEADLALTGCGPHEAPAFKSLGEQACALSIPPDDFDLIAPAPAEQKQMARVWIARQNLIGLRRQAVKPAPHVRHTRRKPDLRIRK